MSLKLSVLQEYMSVIVFLRTMKSLFIVCMFNFLHDLIAMLSLKRLRMPSPAACVKERSPN